MKKWQKATVAVAALGGTMMMVTPAFAETTSTINLSAGGSAQWQNGSSASGTVMDQNSSGQVGQVSGSNYYNSNVNNGFSASQNTYTSNENGPTLNSSQSTSGNSSRSWTRAGNITSQGASVSQGQSQIITSGGYDTGHGGTQGQVSGVISGTLGHETVTGGIALNSQNQNGAPASQTTLSQTSTVQAGDTVAGGGYYNSNVVGTTVNTSNQYTGGVLVSSTKNTNYGGKSYTSASSFSNPTSGFTQDQNQNIGLDGHGGIQNQGAGSAAGQVTNLDNFWSSMY
ncbi:hypothetical protein LLE49_10185 [Alicyclobacillus tolerans]|uniref:hypothetical protein n=1 Tax=Alicyclobacillus tolerans TaxID=90970 RepID=UPI001F1BD65A|nr:hypothetical protein [Alicyclobacillus tolerans]MCF8565082.1 hypothetical protein [Alicyclobacillus tolerans]